MSEEERDFDCCVKDNGLAGVPCVAHGNHCDGSTSDCEPLSDQTRTDCDSAVDWKDRAEAAEAKITRVEALAGELEAADNGSKAADFRLARFVVSEIRTALASAEVSPDA